MQVVRIILFVLFMNTVNLNAAFSQSSFIEKCQGEWEGVMHIFQKGKIIDSVNIVFSVTPNGKNSWNWKTAYLSEKMPLTKNYTMKMADSSSNRFLVDEGDGVVLYDYLFQNKIYGVFETQNILLTSTYELTNSNELIFEVTSGKKLVGPSNEEVHNYSVENLQRVVLKRK
jgi:hypothetical protein